jgi:DedD protein
MDKEMKKLLLVAVSVGFFLLVTITAAIIILTPKTKETPVPSTISSSNGRVQITQPEEVPSVNINQQSGNIDSQENNINPIIESGIAEAEKKDGDNLVISLRPSASVPDDTAQTVEIQKKTEIQAVTAVTAVTPAAAVETEKTPAPAVKPQAVSAPKTTTTIRTTAAVRPAVPAKTINDFWVQTGAFSAIIRAEDAREVLSDKGITSIIENREIDGRIWYRVRLGPYTSEKEANHWLEIVKLIDGFNDSQIRQTVRAN